MALIVETTAGKVEGADHGPHKAFRGIPYAEPPVEDLRFAAPRPARSWTGVRPCLANAHPCPQPPSPLPGMAPGEPSEDCLALNVFTPACDRGRRPVLFWIHGGAFRTGSNAQALYEGRAIVERGDVVLVTINYRLGPLGYLHLDDTPRNLGQRDQILALEWVRDNISQFGGDPDNVTVFGESAGGMATTTLLAMPAARGLFHRAIAQSGAAQGVLDREDAARVRFETLRALDLEGAGADRLRRVPVESLIDASVKAHEKLAAQVFLPFGPALDDDTLPVSPLDAIREGAARDIELITGTTRDEWRLFTFGLRSHRSLDAEALRKRIAARLERLGTGDPASATDRLLEVYRTGRQAWETFDAIETDRHFRRPANLLAEAQAVHQSDTYSYLFSWPSPAARGTLGACHSIELPFVFGTLDAPTMDRFAGRGPDADALSRHMMDAWVAFARSGKPSHAGIDTWEPYDVTQRPTLVFDRESRLERDPHADERRVWDEVL